MVDDLKTIAASSEREPRKISTKIDSETADIIEVGRLPETVPEVEGYLEKIEKEDHFLTNQITDDQTGQILVSSSQAQKPKIILPLTLAEYHFGLKESVETSWRWLAEWSGRLIEMLGSQVGFKINSK